MTQSQVTVSIASRHFRYSLGWANYAPCCLACHVADSVQGSFVVTSKLQIPTTINVIFVDAMTLLVANNLAPSKKYSRLIEAYEYITWPVSTATASLKTKSNQIAASGMAKGSTEVVLHANMQVAELPTGIESVSEIGHTVTVYKFLTTLTRDQLVEGTILSYKSVDYKIFDLQRFMDVWVLHCFIG